MHLLIFGCTESSLLSVGCRSGATLGCRVRAACCGGFSCREAWALATWAPAVAALGLNSCGSWVQLWHVGSSQTRDRTRVSCIDRWIPVHCTTREVQDILKENYSLLIWNSNPTIQLSILTFSFVYLLATPSRGHPASSRGKDNWMQATRSWAPRSQLCILLAWSAHSALPFANTWRFLPSV